MSATAQRAGGAILVIEDEPGIVDFLQRGLARYGYQVSTALDGISGTEKALSQPVDLIVLDMMLPGRSSMQVLASIKGAKPAVPVIALTARSRVNQSRSRGDGGAGLGLAIVRAIAEAHGGSAYVADPDGAGGARVELVLSHFHPA
jgi:CheY-like chemotaxis protein